MSVILVRYWTHRDSRVPFADVLILSWSGARIGKLCSSKVNLQVDFYKLTFGAGARRGAPRETEALWGFGTFLEPFWGHLSPKGDKIVKIDF